MSSAAPPPLPDELGVAERSTRLHGGDIAATWRVTTTSGAEFVVKRTPYDADLEAEGLRALAAAGAPVPTVHHVGEGVLVMDHVAGVPDLEALGAAMANAHDPARAPDGDDGFGWHRDNLLGSVPQHNTPDRDWPRFFVTSRIQPYLSTPALPRVVARRLQDACDGPLPSLLDHAVIPSPGPRGPVARQRRRRPVGGRPGRAPRGCRGRSGHRLAVRWHAVRLRGRLPGGSTPRRRLATAPSGAAAAPHAGPRGHVRLVVGVGRDEPTGRARLATDDGLGSPATSPVHRMRSLTPSIHSARHAWTEGTGHGAGHDTANRAG